MHMAVPVLVDTPHDLACINPNNSNFSSLIENWMITLPVSILFMKHIYLHTFYFHHNIYFPFFIYAFIHLVFDSSVLCVNRWIHNVEPMFFSLTQIRTYNFSLKRFLIFQGRNNLSSKHYVLYFPSEFDNLSERGNKNNSFSMWGNSQPPRLHSDIIPLRHHGLVWFTFQYVIVITLQVPPSTTPLRVYVPFKLTSCN